MLAWAIGLAAWCLELQASGRALPLPGEASGRHDLADSEHVLGTCHKLGDPRPPDDGFPNPKRAPSQKQQHTFMACSKSLESRCPTYQAMCILRNDKYQLGGPWKTSFCQGTPFRFQVSGREGSLDDPGLPTLSHQNLTQKMPTQSGKN